MYWGWCLWKINRGGNRSRQREPSVCDVGLTALKGEGEGKRIGKEGLPFQTAVQSEKVSASPLGRMTTQALVSTVLSRCLGASQEVGLGLNATVEPNSTAPGGAQSTALLPAGSPWRDIWAGHLHSCHRWSTKWNNQRRRKSPQILNVINDIRHSTEGLKIKVEKISQNVE